MKRANSLWNATLLAASLITALSACQTTAPPTVRSDIAPGVKFDTFRTWGFHNPLSTDTQGYETLTTERIKKAIEGQMQRRGFEASAMPDLVVNFDVSTKEAVASSASPRFGISYGGFSGSSGMGVGVSSGGGVKTVTEGTLTVDVVDRAQNQLVWSGTADGTLTKEAVSDPEKLAEAAVQLVFDKFPRPVVDTGNLTPSGP